MAFLCSPPKSLNYLGKKAHLTGSLIGLLIPSNYDENPPRLASGNHVFGAKRETARLGF
jgi:hypothetical protein